MMIESVISRSPLYEDLDSRGAEWRAIDGVHFAVRIRGEEAAAHDSESIGLCDLSGLRKLGLKGADAASWLASEGIDVPTETFASRPLEHGGVIVRFGANEFFLEDGIGNSVVSSLADRFQSHDQQVFPVEHQDATLLLTGSRSLEVLAQTCGINFAESPARKVIFTRVAGVNCGVFPDAIRDLPTYRFWVDPSYAVYLWKTLVEICESLGGRVIGAGCIYPELLS